MSTRRDHLPKWLIGLPHVEVLPVLRRTEVLGDGDELLIGLRFTDATELTLVVFVDHNELSGVTEIAVLRQRSATWSSARAKVLTPRRDSRRWSPLTPGFGSSTGCGAGGSCRVGRVVPCPAVPALADHPASGWRSPLHRTFDG